MNGQTRLRNVRIVRILGLTRAGYSTEETADICAIHPWYAWHERTSAHRHQGAIVDMLRAGTEATTLIPRGRT